MIFPTDDLQKRLDQAEPGDVIELAPGEYRAKVMISKPNLTIRGAGADQTRIVWGDYAQMLDEQGREYTTFYSWTVAVCGDGITMENLSIVNDALHPEIKGQEVALTVYADNFAMRNCTLTSTQDTLFLGPMPPNLIERHTGFLPPLLCREMTCRQVFTDCLIEGTVDFIFGRGEALFENCEIRSLKHAHSGGFLAAPAHNLEQETGFIFRHCRLTAEEGVEPGSIYLARPWRDYGMCEFENCEYCSDHIHPLGFDKWNDTERDKTARFYETPAVSGRVPWARTRENGAR